jgi:hypothetical protein
MAFTIFLVLFFNPADFFWSILVLQELGNESHRPQNPIQVECILMVRCCPVPLKGSFATLLSPPQRHAALQPLA